MNKFLVCICLIVFAIFIGCSDKSSSNPIGIGGDGGNGGVKITIGNSTVQEDGDGDGVVDDIYYFTGSPNVAVKITKFTYSLPAQQFTDDAQGDGTTVYAANKATELVGFLKAQIAAGQQWTFQFEGTEADNGKAFNITSSYTVP